MTELNILTVGQVAERVQLSAKTVMRAIAAGHLEASQLAQGRGGWRIEEQAIGRWLECRSNRQPAFSAERRQGAARTWATTHLALGPEAALRRETRRIGKRRSTQSHPPRPDTPRGIEPRLRRASDGSWRWRYRVRWQDPATNQRRVEEVDTVEEALDVRAHLRLARRRGLLEELTRGEITLAAFFETEYWPNDARRNLQLNTRKTYLPVWYGHLKPRLGHLWLRELNPPTIQLLREQMEEDGIGAPTIRRAMAILQAVCRYALVRGELSANPVKDVRKPPTPRALAVVGISPRQVESLRVVFIKGFVEHLTLKNGQTRQIPHNADPVSAMLVSLLAYEGLRPEDALALEDRHIGKGTILVE